MQMELYALFGSVIDYLYLLSGSDASGIDYDTAREFIKLNVAVYNDSVSPLNLLNNVGLIKGSENLDGYGVSVIGDVDNEDVLVA